MAELNKRPAAERRDERDSAPTASIASTPSIDSRVLLGATGRVVIEHRGQRYELRETRFGKLILTK